MAIKEKKPFALRLNKELMEAIEKWATDEFRSTQSKIEWLLTRAIKDSARTKTKK
jgi:hypothetical protein